MEDKTAEAIVQAIEGLHGEFKENSKRLDLVVDSMERMDRNFSEQIKQIHEDNREIKNDTKEIWRKIKSKELTNVSWRGGVLFLTGFLSVSTSTLVSALMIFLKS